MNTTLDTRRIWIFLALAFGVAWATALVIYLTGGLIDSPMLWPNLGISLAVALLAGPYMFAPAIANALTRWITKEGWVDNRLEFRFGASRGAWWLAWLLPPLLIFLGLAIYYLIFSGHYDPTLSTLTQALAQQEAATGETIGLSPWTIVLIQLGQAFLLAPLLNGLSTFGEEFGWRAYLQPKLMPLGFRKAMLAMGLIWGLWHAPIIAMGHNYGLDYPGAPWSGILAMIWFSTIVGTLFGWLTLRGRSVWPAVIGHAMLNGFGATFLLFSVPGSDANPLLGPGPAGVLASLPFALLAAWLLMRGGDAPAEDVSRETDLAALMAASGEAMIYAEGLSKHFKDVQAVDGLDLSIPRGEVFGLLGPNGAGKTTTIRMLSALIAPSAGSAVVAGHPLGREDRQIRQDVGLLTEAPGMYEQLSAERNLAFFAQLYEVEDIDKQVERYLRMLGLWQRRDDAVGTFSKGMRQKLAIARALLHEPQVLFLDEPTSGLDPEASRVVREFVAELKGMGRTIVLTTHNLDEADRLCDRIAIFKTRLLALDTPTNLRRTLYGRSVVFHLAAVQPAFVSAMQKKDYISQVESVDNKLVLTLDDPEARNPGLINELAGMGAEIQFVGELRRSLEDVYLQFVDDAEKRND